MTANAEIIALGEATYGTKEFAQMKHRLIEYLAQNATRVVVAIEANMTEAHRLNAFIQGGNEELNSILRRMYFWSWITDEFEAMINWMRAYHLSGKGTIDFIGFDMQYMSLTADSVISFLKRVDQPLADSAEKTYAMISKDISFVKTKRLTNNDYTLSKTEEEAARNSIATAKDILGSIESSATRYKTILSTWEVDWGIQQARIVLQATKLQLTQGLLESNFQDSCMAENVKWIKSHAPEGAKVVVWAHNARIGNEPGRMGYYLKEHYKSKYKIFGFKFHEGKYVAYGKKGLNTYKAPPSYSSTIERALHAVGVPLFLLPLPTSSPADSSTEWLYKRQNTKSIGAGPTSDLARESVAEKYDALIYFDQTSPSSTHGLQVHWQTATLYIPALK